MQASAHAAALASKKAAEKAARAIMVEKMRQAARALAVAHAASAAASAAAAQREAEARAEAQRIRRAIQVCSVFVYCAVSLLCVCMHFFSSSVSLPVHDYCFLSCAVIFDVGLSCVQH